jgi:hypothetical protein
MTNLRWATFLVAALAASTWLASCGETARDNNSSSSTATKASSPGTPVSIQGYLETRDTSVWFLILPSESGNVGGQLNTAIADRYSQSGVVGYTTPVMVHIAGAAVGSQVTVVGSGVSWKGQVIGSGLAVLIPDSNGKLVQHTFNAASSDDYNAAVGRLGSAVLASR